MWHWTKMRELDHETGGRFVLVPFIGEQNRQDDTQT